MPAPGVPETRGDETMPDSAITIGIAEDESEFAVVLAHYLASQPDLRVSWVATDGEEALERLAQHSVDLVILDIIMPHLDGIGVLERLKTMDIETVPKVLVLTALGTEVTARRAISLGADYYILKPFDLDVLVRRIRQLVGDRLEPQAELDCIEATVAVASGKEKDISRVLCWLGLSPHVKGFKYLIEAIGLAIDDPSIRGRVTTELYPRIASQNDTTPSRVERAIRHAVKLVYRKGEAHNVESLFGHCVSSDRRPTNSEFIARLSESIRLWQLPFPVDSSWQIHHSGQTVSPKTDDSEAL